MAHSLRYYKDMTQPDGTIIRLEIHKKDSVDPVVEIGGVVQALHLDIQGAQDNIDTPIVKTSLTMTFVDAPDFEYGKKCGNWEEFYTPDSTMWMVVMKVNGTTIWGGYVTPDSYQEDLRYRGSVTILARDNIGHLQDFPFDMEGNADGMITLQELVNAAWAKIESPMILDWRHEEDDANYLLCDGVEAPQTYMNVSAFEDMNFYDAVDKALYSYGLVMRYTGGNVVCIMSLRDMPRFGRTEPMHTKPVFVSHAQRELLPAARIIKESVKYDLREGMQIPLAKGVEFTGEENTVPFISSNIFGEIVTTNIPVHPIDNTSSEGWSNIPSSTLFFNPREYKISADGLKEDAKRMLYLACNTDGSHSVSYHKTVICQDFRISMAFGRVIQRYGSEVHYCYGFASGVENNGIGSIKVSKVSGYILLEQNGIAYYYTGSGWQTELYKINIESEDGKFGIDIGFQNISGQADLSFVIENIELDAMRDFSNGDGLYVPIASMNWGLTSRSSLCEINNVNTNYIDINNVIIDRSPELAPALDEVPFPSIIRNGIFLKSGNAYLPAKGWSWYGGTPQQMAVYNHLQLLCYYRKPANLISGDIVNADFLNIAMIYYWGGSEHLLVAGSYNFLNGRIEGAILREFTRYADMWSDVPGTEMPATEENNKTTADTGGSPNASTYSNVTTVNIGGSGSSGGSSTIVGLEDVKITNLNNDQYLKYDSGLGKWVNRSLDTAMSDTSVNGVQNKTIKSYVDSENHKQPYFRVLGSAGDVDIPSGGGTSGGGSTTGGSPVGAVRLRVVRNVLYVESKTDLSGATVKFARALRKKRKSFETDGGYVASHAWRVYAGRNEDARTPIRPITGVFNLEGHPYGYREEWFDATYPYRYRVVVGTTAGNRYMNATTLLEAFSRKVNNLYRIHSGHGGHLSAKVKMAVIINGIFLPFRFTLQNSGSGLQTYAISPL